MMQFTGLIRKVFATKILLSGKFSPFLTLAAARFNVLQIVYFLSKPLLEKKSGIQMTRDPQTLHEILNSSTADQDDFLPGMSLVLDLICN